MAQWGREEIAERVAVSIPTRPTSASSSAGKPLRLPAVGWQTYAARRAPAGRIVAAVIVGLGKSDSTR